MPAWSWAVTDIMYCDMVFSPIRSGQGTVRNEYSGGWDDDKGFFGFGACGARGEYTALPGHHDGVLSMGKLRVGMLPDTGRWGNVLDLGGLRG